LSADFGGQVRVSASASAIAANDRGLLAETLLCGVDFTMGSQSQRRRLEKNHRREASSAWVGLAR
jgi:hypothetical protein